MNWKDLATQWQSYWQRLERRFPNADESSLRAARNRPDEITRLLAECHDLTELEAREEIEDWMLTQRLARDAADFRVHDGDMFAQK